METFSDEIGAICDDLRRVVMSCEELAWIQSNEGRWFMREEIYCDISKSEWRQVLRVGD